MQGMNGKSCRVYLDNVVVLGKSFDKHLKNLQAVFANLKAKNLKLNSKKCCSFKREVTYLVSCLPKVIMSILGRQRY